MELHLIEVAGRIRALREIMDITAEEMAEFTGVSIAEYKTLENGEADFSFTFLYKCAKRFGVDLMEIVTGEKPKLSFYNIVRKGGGGLPIKRAHSFEYLHLAPLMKDKLAEPFLVTAPYEEAQQRQPIELATHQGQEMDFILEGSLKVQMEDHIEILNEGDSIYYDSGHKHGMIAVGGKECKFLAVVMKSREEN